jgi:CRISPR-associated protein Csd1
MSWIQKLHETYEQCANLVDASGVKPWPLSHLVKKAHVEVVIDSAGNFRRARKLDRIEAPTLIPVSEASAGRTGSIIAPHPLCEEISYCASDFPDKNAKKYEAYETQLVQWCESQDAHPKALSILSYLKKGRLWSDLNEQKIFPVTVEDARGSRTRIKDNKVFVRWRVEAVGDPRSGTWEDQYLIDAWASIDQTHASKHGLCMVLGEKARICKNHPKFIRRSDDGAKLISSNDFNGYTFRGRFTDGKDDYAKQACTVSFEVSQKAHNALRWLIHRQAYRNEEQVIVTWAVAGKPVPDPFKDSLSLFLSSEEITAPVEKPEQADAGDAGQAFALRLKKAIAGYRAQIAPTESIVVMGLDAATPGRMAITFYRELMGSEFLDRIQAWHESSAWPQNFGKDLKFVGVPSPRDIAEAAYGRQVEGKSGEKLRKAAVERLLPCIVDGRPIPHDLVESAIRRTCNRAAFKKDKKGGEWEWEKNLGIACALFRGHHKEREYKMTLEQDRKSRDYLFGCLLAVADRIEGWALYLADEKRDTSAAKLMQRFADRPYSTWRTIELSLTPYKTRLRSKDPFFLYEKEKLLDELVCSLGQNFTIDKPLTGEFLLGYHCQRQALRPPPKSRPEKN